MQIDRREVEISRSLGGRPPSLRSGYLLDDRLILTARRRANRQVVEQGSADFTVRQIANDTAYTCHQLLEVPPYGIQLFHTTDAAWESGLGQDVLWAQPKGDLPLQCSVGAVLSGQFDLYDALIKPWMFSRDGLLTVALRDHQITSATSLTGFVGACVISQNAIAGVIVDISDTRSLLMAPTSSFATDVEFQRLVRRETGSRPEITTISGTSDDSFGAAALQSLAAADAANTQEVAASQLAISNSYYESVLSQARRSFAAAIVSAAIGSAFFISAVFVALSSGVFSAAILSTIGGAIVEVISGLNFWLYSKTSNQLETFHVRLERTQRFLLANSVAENLHDDRERDQAIVKLVDTISMATNESRDQRIADPGTT